MHDTELLQFMIRYTGFVIELPNGDYRCDATDDSGNEYSADARTAREAIEACHDQLQEALILAEFEDDSTQAR